MAVTDYLVVVSATDGFHLPSSGATVAPIVALPYWKK